MADRALVVLDTCRPLAARDRLVVDVAPGDVVLTGDGALSAGWLAERTGRDVRSARTAASVARQDALEALAREFSESVKLKVHGVALGPCTEYALLLWLVSANRDTDVLRAVRDLAREAPLARITLVTDRERHAGLARALESAGGCPVAIVRGASVRYVDRVLAQYAPREASYSAEELDYQRNVHRVRSEAISGPTVFATERQVRELEGDEAVEGSLEEIAARPSNAREGDPDLRLAVEWFHVAEPVTMATLGPRRFSKLEAHIERAVGKAKPRILERTARALNAGDVLDLLTIVAEDYLDLSLERSLRAAAYTVEANATLVGDPRCKALLVWNDVLPAERSLVDYAKSRRVPTVMEQHGVVGIRTMHDRPRTDWIAAWGPVSWRWWSEVGFPEARVRVVGSAGLRLHGTPAERPEGIPRVLYASQPYVGFLTGEDLLDSQRALVEVEAACRSAGYRLVAKPHPLERHDDWGCELEAGAEVHLDEPIPALVRTCNALVTRSSTSLLFALDAGVPCVVVETEQFAGINSFRGIMELNPLGDEAALAEAITRAISSPPSPETLRAILNGFTIPGDSAERLLTMLKEIA